MPELFCMQQETVIRLQTQCSINDRRVAIVAMSFGC